MSQGNTRILYGENIDQYEIEHTCNTVLLAIITNHPTKSLSFYQLVETGLCKNNDERSIWSYL